MHGNPRSYTRTYCTINSIQTTTRLSIHYIRQMYLPLHTPCKHFEQFFYHLTQLFWKLEKGSAISINCYCSAYLPTYLVLFMSVNHALSSQQLLQCQYCAKMKHRIIIVNTIWTPIQGVSGRWQFP